MTQKKPVIEEVRGRVDRLEVLLSQGTEIIFGFADSEYHGYQQIYISEDDEVPFAVNEFPVPQSKRPKYQLDTIETEQEAFGNAYRAIQSMEELSRRMPEVAEAIQEAEDY